jgi:hypothetical protein
MRHEQTQHAFLVAWGWFAERIGLLDQLAAVPIKQKTRCHTPQGKILEALVATLAGLEHLQDISRAAHPLDKDTAVAHAWGQAAWADYSGVSRTLSRLTQTEAQAIVDVLAQVSRPLIDEEVHLLRQQEERLCLDGDLTGLPVSNTSRTYPDAAFGHMNNDIRLGYQAALVSLVSPSYGRLWLSAEHHPGDTVSATQAEALVRAAEARLERRPRRCTDLLQTRLQALDEQIKQADDRVSVCQQMLAHAEARVVETERQIEDRRLRLTVLETDYVARGRKERPTGMLAQARKRLTAAKKRLSSRQCTVQTGHQRLSKARQRLETHQTERQRLGQQLAVFEAENADNPQPVKAEFRLDAGFGTYQNLTMLIEMGYEVYTKPYSHQVVQSMRQHLPDDADWEQVGANAEMVQPAVRKLAGCPYPLDIALERFHTGKTIKHSVLLHFGEDKVSENLPDWFEHYNSRQTIEAGIKEGKGVFSLHRLKVRSAPAIYLQEQFVIFAANFIRWATRWLTHEALPANNALAPETMGIKQQVKVAAHVSARVIYNFRGRLLKFSDGTVFAGKILRLPKARSRQKHRKKSCLFTRFLMKLPPIAQKLR